MTDKVGFGNGESNGDAINDLLNPESHSFETSRQLYKLYQQYDCGK